LLLLFDENFSCLAAVEPALVPDNPGIDAGADIRIDAVDGDGHMADIVLEQFIHVFGQRQTIWLGSLSLEGKETSAFSTVPYISWASFGTFSVESVGAQRGAS
jgi:hypothetical protein